MEKYYYGIGRARSLEAKFLTPAQLSRMAAANDFASAFSVLSETPYAENLGHLKTSFDFEELCELERSDLRELLLKLSLNNEFIAALCQKIDPDYYHRLLKLSQSLPSSLIKNMVKYKLDLVNLKTLLRSKELEKSKEDLKKLLLKTGFIDQDTLLELFNKNLTDIAAKLTFTPYFPEISKGLEYYTNNKSFYLLEKAIDDFILKQFKKAKYLGSGLEPLVGFYLAKEQEIKTIRFILISKKNHVNSERIKERLRISY